MGRRRDYDGVLGHHSQTRMQQNAHMKRMLDREVSEIDREVMGTQMNTKSQVRSWGG